MTDADLPPQDDARFRVYTAPGEGPDLVEATRWGRIDVVEIAAVDELVDVEEPGVLFLSRGLLGRGGSHQALASLPAQVAVVAADDGARTAAEQAGRLFMAAADLAPGRHPLMRTLASAHRYARVCLERDEALRGQ